MRAITSPTAVKVTFPYQSLTDVDGVIWGVAFFGADASAVSIYRKIDWLSPQFASAAASGKAFSSVTIQTPSGHRVQFGPYAELWPISKAGTWPPFAYPGAGPVPAGMEGITWVQPNVFITVDGVPQGPSYDWLSLNS